VALDSCLGVDTPLCPRGAWALPKCWAHLVHTGRLCSCLWLGTLQHTCGAWVVSLGAGHTLSAHVALGHIKTQLSLDPHAAVKINMDPV
jgi:hypothetical protein